MPKPNDKHARELKRQAKKRAAAKAAAGDAWTATPVDDARLNCVRSGDLQLDGQCGIDVLLDVPGRGHASAAFLIDRGVVGLKSAWGLAHTSVAEFNETLADLRADGLPLEIIPPAAARALVAGAARYADEYGLRLPKDWTRWAGVLGGVGDWRTADTGPFRPEYAETIQYARERLVGSTPEAFFARPDVTFDLPEGETRPADPDARPVHPAGATVDSATADEWVEPTRDAYAAILRRLDRRRASIVADVRATLAELGLEPGPHVAEDAVAVRAAALCLATFGRPPTRRVDAALAGLPVDVEPTMRDAAYFFGRIVELVLGRSPRAGESLNVLRADAHAIARFERRARDD